MNQEYELVEVEELDIYEEMHRLIELNPWAWQSIGAVSGLVGGVLSPVVGTLLIALAWFINPEEGLSTLNVLSIASFVLTIPLLTFGAHCLDLLERKTVGEQQLEESASTSAGLSDPRQGYTALGINFH